MRLLRGPSTAELNADIAFGDSLRRVSSRRAIGSGACIQQMSVGLTRSAVGPHGCIRHWWWNKEEEEVGAGAGAGACAGFINVIEEVHMHIHIHTQIPRLSGDAILGLT